MNPRVDPVTSSRVITGDLVPLVWVPRLNRSGTTCRGLQLTPSVGLAYGCGGPVPGRGATTGCGSGVGGTGHPVPCSISARIRGRRSWCPQQTALERLYLLAPYAPGGRARACTRPATSTRTGAGRTWLTCCQGGFGRKRPATGPADRITAAPSGNSPRGHYRPNGDTRPRTYRTRVRLRPRIRRSRDPSPVSGHGACWRETKATQRPKCALRLGAKGRPVPQTSGRSTPAAPAVGRLGRDRTPGQR